MELVRASVRTLIFTIVRAIVFCDRVHDRTNDLFSRSRVRTPGLARDLFVGPGFDSLALQHDLFVGPGFDSRTRSPVFRPIVSVAYVNLFEP